jgi:arylsulfatase A-like enzyme
MTSSRSRRPQSRRAPHWWLFASLAVCSLACGSQPPPNVVLIIIDTLRADRLGSYGYPQPTSPELDALAATGVRFARTIAPSSWTRPSIASLLTGRYPRSVGIYDEQRHILADRFETLAEIFSRSGYATLGITANPNINSSYNFHQGFDEYLDSNVLWPWMPGEAGKKQGYEHPMQTSREMFDLLLERLANDRSRPTYLQACVMEVHGAFSPGVVDDRFVDRFPRSRDRRYLGAVAMVSAEVDRFVRRLSALPGWHDTLFVITSDHGQGLFDHPDVAESRLHGRLLYDSHTAVPLILHHPPSAAAAGDTGVRSRLPGGTVVERPVRLLDVPPTLLDFAGVPIPDGLDGVSLLPLLDRADASLPPVLISETEYRDMKKIAAFEGDWKYVASRDGHAGTAPRELQRSGRPENGRRTDVSARHPERVERLAAYVAKWEAEHPREKPTLQERALPPAEVEQLKALGYLP